MYGPKRFKKRIIKIEHLFYAIDRTDVNINIEKQYPLRVLICRRYIACVIKETQIKARQGN